ncbi:ryanodine Receptor TM 4-6 [Oesophagostomum dentatum]|uniref:Ryanodine Receptor TM 4-6 n=1 Tax=Oesophagostomum dentatum TaxID=61180 RepID=A0A0B1S3F4_OESDE|nr:ryanodine Receptor TM 4-6 [Oesophagostomum dentatum]
MGSSKRVEKIYFEIQEAWLEQWGKQQIRDSKNSFLFNVLQDDGGDQGKLEAFINFCEDTIFEMQHAAEISAGDTDSKVERALKQRDYFLQQTSAGEQITETFKSGYHYGVNAASALRPENVKQAYKSISTKVKQMTWMQLVWAIIVLMFHFGKSLGYCAYLLLMTLFRFAYFLTTPDREEEGKEEVNDYYESIGAPPAIAAPPSDADLAAAGAYEPKIAEQNVGRSKGSILNMLARNFKPIEMTTLYLAFFINVILLFHRVDIKHVDAPEGAEGGDDDDDTTIETVFISGILIPYIDYELTGWVLAQVRCI